MWLRSLESKHPEGKSIPYDSLFLGPIKTVLSEIHEVIVGDYIHVIEWDYVICPSLGDWDYVICFSEWNYVFA